MIRIPPPPVSRGPLARWTGDVAVPVAPLPFRPEEGLPLMGRGHLDRAQQEWQAQLDAGRIGVAPPSPAPGGEHRLASLAAILGIGRRERVW